MPSFDKFPIFVTDDRTENRPKCVFDKGSLQTQMFRVLQFEDVSSPEIDENQDRTLELAAQAQSEFKAELERHVQKAKSQGIEEGYQQAADTHEKERQSLKEKMEGAFNAMNLALDKAEEVGARDALRLGIRVAERIARGVLSKNVDALVANLMECINRTEEGAELKIVASEEVAETLRSNSESILQDLGVQQWTIEADSSLQPGDLMIYRGSSALDARIATRIQAIESELLKELGICSEAEAE